MRKRRGSLKGTVGVPGLQTHLHHAIKCGDADAAAGYAREIAHIVSERRERERVRTYANNKKPVPYDHRVIRKSVEPHKYPTYSSEPIAPGYSEYITPQIREAVTQQTAHQQEQYTDELDDRVVQCTFCFRVDPRPFRLEWIAGVPMCAKCAPIVKRRLNAARLFWQSREARKRRAWRS